VSETGPADLLRQPIVNKRGDGRKPAAFAADFIAFIRERPSYLAGYIIVLGMLLIGLVAPVLPLLSPVDADATAYLEPPSWAHPMGTDVAGLDVFSRVLHAPRVDLAIALVSTLWAAALGAVLGAFAGLWEGTGRLKGPAALLVVRLADIVQAFPVFALALVLVAVMGQGVVSIIIAIGTVNVPLYLRLMRSEALNLRSQNYVEAARIAGASDSYLIFRHIIPNAAAPLMAQMSINTGVAVLLAASLSFIGAGVRAPTPEWGSMIAMGFQNVVTGQWWPSVFPGIALALTVFGLGRIGASILAWASPRERSRPSRRAWRDFVAGKR
jgi:peptide/nickel transport system permease protein